MKYFKILTSFDLAAVLSGLVLGLGVSFNLLLLLLLFFNDAANSLLERSDDQLLSNISRFLSGVAATGLVNVECFSVLAGENISLACTENQQTMA